MTFHVVDKTTGQDLFFGSTAKYKLSQIKMFHIVNGVADTAMLRKDSVNQFFNVLVPPAHNVDTVTMQIAGLPQDILLFNTSNTGGCCSRLVLNSISYNGATVYTSGNGPNVVMLAK